MATSGEGFAAGLRAGGGLVSQALENQRLDAAEQRAADDYKQKVADRDRTNKAWDDYTAATAPRAQGLGLKTLQDTYGMTPEQAAAPDALAKARSYDVPDSSDLQNVPARGAPATPGLPTDSPVTPQAGGAPPVNPNASPFAVTADQVSQRAPSRMEQEQAMQGLSTKLRDAQGIRASQQEQRKIQFDDTLSGAMKEKMDVVRSSLAGTNLNTSAYPLLMGVKGKNGYTTLTTIDDKTGEPTAEYKFTDPQLRQIYAAQKLAEAGYGEQSLKMLTDVDKSLGEHFKSWNDATDKAATVSNTAQRYANSDANDAARTGIAAKTAANAEARARAGDYNAIGISPDGKSIQVWDTKMNRMGTVPVQEGMDAKQQLQLMREAQGRGGPKKGEGLKEFPERGKVMQDAQGNTVKSDGVGGYIDVNGKFKDEVPGTLTKDFGFQPQVAQQMAENLSPDGTEIWWNGNKYPMTRASMNILKEDVDKQAREEKVAGETVKRVASAPGRRSAREDVASRMDTVNRGLRVPGVPEARDMYLNTDE